VGKDTQGDSKANATAKQPAWRVKQNQVASGFGDSYHRTMVKAEKFDLDQPFPIADDEDPETLAAIDQGIRDSAAGRTVPSEEVRKLLPQWISASNTRKEL
jgi:hypothetical protein